MGALSTLVEESYMLTNIQTRKVAPINMLSSHAVARQDACVLKTWKHQPGERADHLAGCFKAASVFKHWKHQPGASWLALVIGKVAHAMLPPESRRKRRLEIGSAVAF